MNGFNIGDELILRNCFVTLLLDKSIYKSPLINNSIISLFNSVTTCIITNLKRLIKKEVLIQLPTYSNLIERNNDPHNSSRRDSHPFLKWRKNYDLNSIDVDINSTSKTFALKKRALVKLFLQKGIITH